MRSPRKQRQVRIVTPNSKREIKISDELAYQHATVLTSNIEVFVVARR